MSASATQSSPGACDGCLRRSWLLASLGPTLDYRASDRDRLLELLALEDAELLAALAGARKLELSERYESFKAPSIRRGQAVCCHDPLFPRPLRSEGAPHMLNVDGGAQRLHELLASAVVTIVGSPKPTDYGLEMAMGLGRGLAASGITVTASMGDGIARAALAGALEASGAAVAVVGSGLDVLPGRWGSLLRRLQHSGCAVSELPRECRGRRWGAPAGERILAALADLLIVVEAEQSPQELAPARIASALGRAVGALPGRVSSPLSSGPHELLGNGAALLRGTGDVLELLHSLGAPRATHETLRSTSVPVEPRLRRTLARVASGCDTPEKLTRGVDGAEELLLALSELELMGLLARGDGGRYVPREPWPQEARPPRAPSDSNRDVDH